MSRLRAVSTFVCGVLAAASLAACSPDGYDPGEGPGLQGPDEGVGDASNMALGIQCTGTISLSGSVSAADPIPEDVEGCWPDGTWTVNATLETHDCPTAPAIPAQFVYVINRDADTSEETYMYQGTGDGETIMKVSSGGIGVCEGSFEHWSADGKALMNIKPNLMQDLVTLQGDGDFELYHNSQL